MLLRNSGATPLCPICKEVVSRRSIMDSPLFDALSAALENGISSFGLALDDSCHVSDQVQEAVVAQRKAAPGGGTLGVRSKDAWKRRP
jgi:hypothetical protein